MSPFDNTIFLLIAKCLCDLSHRCPSTATYDSPTRHGLTEALQTEDLGTNLYPALGIITALFAI
jgi:hypothetical protein